MIYCYTAARIVDYSGSHSLSPIGPKNTCNSHIETALIKREGERRKEREGEREKRERERSHFIPTLSETYWPLKHYSCG